jgi:hypothetical protein
MEITEQFSQLAWIFAAIVVVGCGIYSLWIERYLLDIRKVRISLSCLPRSFSLPIRFLCRPEITIITLEQPSP